MKFNNNDQEAQAAKEFVRNAVSRRFQGDSQEMFNHLPDFLETDALKALLKRYESLQDDIFLAWQAEGYGNSQSDIVLDTVSEETLAEDEGVENDAIVVSNAEMPAEIHLNEVPFDDESPILEDAAEFLEDDPKEEENEGQNSDTESNLEEETENKMEEPIPSGPTVIPVKLVFNNGKTGVEYDERIDLSSLNRPFESIVDVKADGFEDIGLDFDAESFKIKGLPEKAGKFTLKILVEFEATTDRPAQIYKMEGTLDIMPDPRNLWKEIEPDPSLPYPKAHTSKDNLPMWGRYMIAASRRGRSHAHGGTYRDDDFALAINETEGWYIIAVADGAGSAPFSRKGAQIACERSVAEIQTKLTHQLSRELEAMAVAYNAAPTEQLRQQIRSRIYEPLSHSAYAGYKAITAEAEKIGQPVKTFHTTLMITIVKQFDFGYFVGTWWVGDGGVGVYQRRKSIKVMGNPDGGEFAGQTRFLTMPEIWADGETVLKRIEFEIVEDFTAIILMSDGITDPKIGTDYNLGQIAKWDELWDDISETVDFDPNNIDADAQLLDWLDFWAAGEHDDRTIAILY